MSGVCNTWTHGQKNPSAIFTCFFSRSILFSVSKLILSTGRFSIGSINLLTREQVCVIQHWISTYVNGRIYSLSKSLATLFDIRYPIQLLLLLLLPSSHHATIDIINMFRVLNLTIYVEKKYQRKSVLVCMCVRASLSTVCLHAINCVKFEKCTSAFSQTKIPDNGNKEKPRAWYRNSPR